MTMPVERLNAVKAAKNFLRDLLDPKKTPRVPRKVRLEAYRILKHYPTIIQFVAMADKLPKHFALDYDLRVVEDFNKGR